MELNMVIIVMGVSGSGKSTVGEMLAARLRWAYHEADDFHPQANVEKMSKGMPLNDQDREPWLDAIRVIILKHLQDKSSAVITCSALKENYRQQLKPNDNEAVEFVFLQGDFDLINERMQQRAGHFMKAEMLKSQFDTLEPPKDALTVDISPDPQTICDEIVKAFALD